MIPNDKTTQHSDDRPGDNHPDDQTWTSPAKRISEIEKLDIKESGDGRYRSQAPDDEHIEHRISQIDEGTQQLQGWAKEDDAEVSKLDDNRDANDSTTDWNAEQNNSGRHK